MLLPPASVSLATTLEGIGLTGALFGLPATAAAMLGKRFWATDRWMALPCALAGLVVVGLLTFFAWLAGPALGLVVDLAVVLAALAVCGRHLVPAVRDRGLAGVARACRRGTPLLLTTGGLVLVTLGLTYLWTSRADLFLLSAQRFSHPLPWDNELPAIISNRLADGLDPRGQLSSWLTSDRPPLQSGLQLFVEPLLGRLPIRRPALLAEISVTAQLVWIPSAYAVCRSIGVAPRIAILVCSFAGLSGTVLLNTVFTWPKLLCAGLLLAALSVALRYRARPRPGEAVLLAILTAGGMLAHGAGLFFLPVLVAVLLWRRIRTARISYLAAGAATFVAAYLPWMAYQRFYDPPGNRLLYYQVAGVTKIVKEPFLSLLIRRYAEIGWSGTVDNKLANLYLPVSAGPLEGLGLSGLDVGARRISEFYVLSTAVGLAVFPLLLLIATATFRSARRRGNTRATRSIVGLLVASALSLLVWALVLFGPGATFLHVSPLSPLLLALLLPAAWVAERSEPWMWHLVVLQAVLLLATYAPTMHGGSLARSAVAAITVGFGLLLLSVVLAQGRVHGSVVRTPAAERESVSTVLAGRGPRQTSSDTVRILLN
ncbi:MAG: hypothetical protein JWO67_6542 [Streptosporangiaceae bacterium]|nr:hypothetical protein [Streptosporangiaceae bacterium]